MVKLKYFKDSEIFGLEENLVFRLDKARECSGIPFIITSGLRSIEKNKEIGGVDNSAHLKGLAVDIRCLNDSQKYAIIGGAIMAGFERIGIGKNHIHLDIDKSKPYRVIFIEE